MTAHFFTNTLFTNVHKNDEQKSIDLSLQRLEESLKEIREELAAIHRKGQEVSTREQRVMAAIASLKGERFVMDDITHPPVRPNQFKDMKRSVALKEYLRDRPGGVRFAKALKDLLDGGLEKSPKGAAEDRRLLTIAVSNNWKTIGYNADNDELTLKPKPEPKKK